MILHVAPWLHRALALAGLLCLAGCSNLDFGDNPGHDVPKADAALTAFPSHLRNGSR